MDSKSHFTFRHSMGVADRRGESRRNLGLPADRVRRFDGRRCRHHIGKLSVSKYDSGQENQADGGPVEGGRAAPGADAPHPGADRVLPRDRHRGRRGSREVGWKRIPEPSLAADLLIESRLLQWPMFMGVVGRIRPYRAGLRYEEILPIMCALLRESSTPLFNAPIGLIGSSATFCMSRPRSGRGVDASLCLKKCGWMKDRATLCIGSRRYPFRG